MTARRPDVACANCGEVRKHEAHGLCKPCYMRRFEPRRRTWPRDDLLAEVETLLDTDTDSALAARLGVTPAAIERAAYRAGRRDLARRFGRARMQQVAA